MTSCKCCCWDYCCCYCYWHYHFLGFHYSYPCILLSLQGYTYPSCILRVLWLSSCPTSFTVCWSLCASLLALCDTEDFWLCCHWEWQLHLLEQKTLQAIWAFVECVLQIQSCSCGVVSVHWAYADTVPHTDQDGDSVAWIEACKLGNLGDSGRDLARWSSNNARLFSFDVCPSSKNIEGHLQQRKLKLRKIKFIAPIHDLFKISWCWETCNMAGRLCLLS